MGLVRPLVRLVGVGFVILRISLPLVVRMMVHLLVLEVTCIIALIRGVPETVDIMAEEWQHRTHVAGMDARLDRVLYQVYRVLAYVILCVGWVLMAAVTLALIDIVL